LGIPAILRIQPDGVVETNPLSPPLRSPQQRPQGHPSKSKLLAALPIHQLDRRARLQLGGPVRLPEFHLPGEARQPGLAGVELLHGLVQLLAGPVAEVLPGAEESPLADGAGAPLWADQPPFSPSPISTTTSAGTQLKKQIPSSSKFLAFIMNIRNKTIVSTKLVLASALTLTLASAASGAITLRLGTTPGSTDGVAGDVTNVYAVDAAGAASITTDGWAAHLTASYAPSGDTGVITPFSFSLRSVAAGSFTLSTGIEVTTGTFASNSLGYGVSGGPGGNFTSSSSTVSEGNVFYFTIPLGVEMTISQVRLNANGFDEFDEYAVINGINDSTTGAIDIDQSGAGAQTFTLAAPIVVIGTGAEQHVVTLWNPGGTDGDEPGGWKAQQLVVSFVPEPSSTALLGIGGLALILRRRK